MIPYSPPKPAEFIPLIDLAASFSGEPERLVEVAQQIHRASRDTGFFYIKNHRVPQLVVDNAFAASRKFFEQSIEKKREVLREKWPVPRGYEPLLHQRLDEGTPPDLKESFYIARELGADHPDVIAGIPNTGPNQWPSDLPNYREDLERYLEEMLDLGRHLMKLIALSLSLDQEYFASSFKEPAATLRLLRYPPQPSDAAENQLGSGAHTDFGAITLLAQDNMGGLEVENAAGEWIRAEPIPGTFVINLGDMIKRWTNDIYHSNMHRVLNNVSGRDRYSMALFFNPHYRTSIATVPTCLRNGASRYTVCTAGEHVAERVKAAYVGGS